MADNVYVYDTLYSKRDDIKLILPADDDDDGNGKGTWKYGWKQELNDLKFR